MYHAGFDSAEYRRQFEVKGKTHVTRGLLGVGIRTEDVERFRGDYSKALSNVFKKYKEKQDRPAYCAAEMSAIFGSQTINKEKEVLEQFFNEMLPSIDQVHFFYTYLFKFNQVTIFGDDPDGYERIPVMAREKGVTDFYDLIFPSYTLLCAWKYQRDLPKDQLLLDHFQGKVCPAWNEFIERTNASVYYNGDRCNALISTADLICRLLKLRMLQSRKPFIEEEMNSILPEAKTKFIRHFLGSYYLKKMIPHKRTRINGSKLVKHPMRFMIREHPEEDEREMVQSTPAFNKLLREAFEENGCFKFFDPSGDSRMLTKQDTILTYGERGEQIVKELKKLGTEFSYQKQ